MDDKISTVGMMEEIIHLRDHAEDFSKEELVDKVFQTITQVTPEELLDQLLEKKRPEAKYIIKVQEVDHTFVAKEVFDNKSQFYRNKEFIKERGIDWFLDLSDLKETLNWNLNGDSSKYQFVWDENQKTGKAYVFD